MDPNKPHAIGNLIPQCSKCNRADRNNWVYDERGRVINLGNRRMSGNKEMINKIILGNAEEVLTKIENNSIDLVLTDPPYFLDKMDNKRFYEWYAQISKELYRVLIKPKALSQNGFCGR